MPLLTRIKNLWALSEFSPKQYNIGFKWAGTLRGAPEKLPANPATIVQDNAIKNELDQND